MKDEHDISSDPPWRKRQVIRELLELRRENDELRASEAVGRQVRIALQESETRYRQLAELCPDVIIVYSKGHIVFINAAGTAMLGASEASELIGKPVIDFIHPDHQEAAEQQVRQVLEEKRPLNELVEHKLMRPDGHTVDVEVALTPLTYHDQPALLVVIRDISERVRAESQRNATLRALRESEAKFRELVQNANSIIFRMDIQGRVTFFNEFAQEFFGYAEQEILGRQVVGTIVPQTETSGRDLAAMIRDLLQNPGRYASNENENMRRGGERVWVAWTNSAICGHEGLVAEILCVGNDITGRVRAEEALRESENRFRALIEQSPFSTIIYDPNGRVVYGNPAALELHELSDEEYEHILNQYNILEDEQLESKGSLPYIRKGFAGEATTIPPIGYERKKEEATGGAQRQVVWIDGFIYPIKDEQGKTREVVLVHNDISERVRAEEEIRQLKEFNESIVQNMAEGITVQSADGHFTFVNPATETLLCYAPGELAGQHWTAIVPADQQPIVQAANRRRARGEADQYELELARKDGSRIPVLISGSPRHEDGNYAGTLAVFTDISERVKAEEQLRRRNRELTLLNQIIAASASGLKPEAILETACRELALTLNVAQSAAILLNDQKTAAAVVAEYRTDGRSSALNTTIPVTESPSLQFILSNQAPLVVRDVRSDPSFEPIHDLMRQRGTVSLLVLPLVTEGEVIGSLDLDADELRHFSAEELSLAWSVADQVAGELARARLNEQRRRLEAQYRQAQKMEAVGRLTAGIAHDFNNLLTAINGFTELMHIELLPNDPIQESVEKVLRSGRRAADLVRQLLAFSRKQIIEPQVLNVNAVVDEMDKMLRRIIGEDIKLQTTLTSDPWSVKMDPMQIQQVIANLAVNARDAMPEGGELTIETANVVLDETYDHWDGDASMDGYAAEGVELQPGEYVLLAVSDSGVGMSDEVKAHLFEPFFTTKEPGKGTGLGLATVYGAVKQSGGDIRVYSETGTGTSVKIYLPRAEAAVRTTFGHRGMVDVPHGEETILLTEDDESVRDLASRVLQRQGHSVLEARDGQEALQLFANHSGPIHMLVTDVVMPGTSGKVLAEELTQARPDLKVLFMSGYTDEAIVHHGVLEPGVAFLQKPFSPTDLARKVRQVLDAS